MRFKPESAEAVYEVLANHQSTDASWELNSLITWLQEWARRFNEVFELDIPSVSLCVDWLSRKRLGHFRPGHNGFGLSSEVAINRRYLPQRPQWKTLGTLLHELLHAWQQTHGTPGKNNYHNREFRDKAESLGLVIDSRGHTLYLPESRFMDLLRQHSVNTSDAVQADGLRTQMPGRSKLKKWVCCCIPPVNVRVAVPHFHAQCLRCGQIFKRVDGSVTHNHF